MFDALQERGAYMVVGGEKRWYDDLPKYKYSVFQ
jgi:hypothetical protein